MLAVPEMTGDESESEKSQPAVDLSRLQSVDRKASERDTLFFTVAGGLPRILDEVSRRNRADRFKLLGAFSYLAVSILILLFRPYLPGALSPSYPRWLDQVYVVAISDLPSYGNVVLSSLLNVLEIRNIRLFRRDIVSPVRRILAKLDENPEWQEIRAGAVDRHVNGLSANEIHGLRALGAKLGFFRLRRQRKRFRKISRLDNRTSDKYEHDNPKG
jgi:hypothetical protein